MSAARRSIVSFSIVVFGLAVAADAIAQNATITVGSQKQFIRGFGGMSHAAWIGDMTAAQRALAFGNGDGQLGFTILRIPVSDGAPDTLNVATARAALAAGAIVFATPWNPAATYAAAQFPAYATHLNDFVSFMKGQGVDLYAISVQNEPDFGAQAGWGSWTAASCHDFILNFRATITTKLMSCESFNYNKTYYDPVLNDPAALANTDLFGTHLYGTAVANYPYPLFDQKSGGKERWMTEHYTDSTTDADSWPNALGVATEMHHAMVDAQFNAYVWWYIVRSYGPIKAPGTVSKRGWCMAQFSKFIRPGFHRVDATASPMSGVFLSAYASASDVVAVIVNTNTSAASLRVSVAGSSIASYDRFTTSGSKSLSNDGTVTASNGSLSLSLDPQSVTTLHGTGMTTTGTGGATGAGGAMGAGGSNGTGGARDAGSAPDSRGLPGAGGTTGAGGAPGLGGTTGTGNSAGAAGGATAGAGGSRGAGGAFGAGGATGAGELPMEGGCACGTGGARPISNPFTLGALGVAALVLIRRRRKVSAESARRAIRQ
jgi:glucuronoarabinoxylan endo-1,4-beta-xylanase